MVPWFATAFMITALTSIGLPGTSGFVGEFLALIGTFQARPVMAIIAASGVIFAAYYMLPMVQKVFFNALEKPENKEMPDLSRRELTILAPMVALMIWIGCNPTPFLRRMEPSVNEVIRMVTGTAPEGTTTHTGLVVGEDVPVTFSSTAPLDAGEDPDDPASAHPGDEE